MRLRRFLLLGSLIALAGLLLTSCAGSSQQPAASGATSEPGPRVASSPRPAPTNTPTVTAHHTFAPYDPSGQLTATVRGATRTGTCWTTSIAIPIAGVYRCFAANEIFDPCFAPAAETSPLTVACFADPWHPGTLLTLRGPLPKDDPLPTDGHPWALQLANSARCVAITGVVPTVDGVAVEYTCDGGDVAGLGTSAAGPLIARYGSMHGPLTAERVVAEWRGRSYRISPTE